MALTADSPYTVENCKTLSVVAVVVDGLDLRGKIIGKHGMDPVYTFERSQILGGEMFVTITFSCIVGAAYHVKFGLAEYVFLQLGRDRTAKDMMLDLSSLKIFE